jgi:hypothetical protein
VSYIKEFWLATAAAAPVIALAAVAALPDTSAVVDVASKRLREAERNRLPDPGHGLDRLGYLADIADVFPTIDRWGALLLWGTTIANLLVQAGLLAVSLSALAYEQNVIPVWASIVMAVGGILLLAWTITSGAGFRRRFARMQTEETGLRDGNS